MLRKQPLQRGYFGGRREQPELGWDAELCRAGNRCYPLGAQKLGMAPSKQAICIGDIHLNYIWTMAITNRGKIMMMVFQNMGLMQWGTHFSDKTIRMTQGLQHGRRFFNLVWHAQHFPFTNWSSAGYNWPGELHSPCRSSSHDRPTATTPALAGLNLRSEQIYTTAIFENQ